MDTPVTTAFRIPLTTLMEKVFESLAEIDLERWRTTLTNFPSGPKVEQPADKYMCIGVPARVENNAYISLIPDDDDERGEVIVCMWETHGLADVQVNLTPASFNRRDPVQGRAFENLVSLVGIINELGKHCLGSIVPYKELQIIFHDRPGEWEKVAQFWLPTR
jgi:hypothetical protein